MATKLRKIGNSLGVVIPKLLLNDANLSGDDLVNIYVQQGKIVMEKANAPREGWEDIIRKAKEQEEPYFPSELENKFDQEEWTW